jgi:hypothetical protein
MSGIRGREREIRALLRQLIDEVAAALGDRKTVNEIIQQALKDAVDLYQPLVPQIVARVLRPMVRKQLGQSRPSGGSPAMVPLLGFEKIRLPVHIVIPPSLILEADVIIPEENEDEDQPHETEADQWPWVVLGRARIGEGRSNVAYRDKLLAGAQVMRDRVNAVVESAAAAGGTEHDIIGEILR